MTILISCIAILERESKFYYHYSRGMKKDEYWEYALEDSLDLIAMLPSLAAGIYRLRYDKGHLINSRHDLDWAGNLAHMMGVEGNQEEFANLMRLYMVLHSDHEGGNVSARACHTIGSALSDPYYSVLGGLAGLAGPLHGLANQEGVRFVLDVLEKFKGVPSDDDLRKTVKEMLDSGRVIPGYGHAVLRVPDPRFTAQMQFAKQHFPQDDLVQLADLVFDVVPAVLKEQGKAKNPAPNVDAISGTLQHYYGVREFDFYTVLFGVGRALGVTANYVWMRALGMPIERPKSLTTKMLEDVVEKAKAAQPVPEPV